MGSLRVGITGGNGFIGSNLTGLLKSKKINFSLLNDRKHFLFKKESLKDFVKDKDIIFHLAASIRDDDEKMFKVNALGTANLLRAMIEYGPKNNKIIFTSTFQIYNSQTKSLIVKEDGLIEPSSFHAVSKFAAEQLIKFYCRDSKLKGIILRLSNVYGPGGRPFYNSVIATFLDLIKNDQPLIINGDGKQSRDFIFIDDVVDALYKSISFIPQNCETFNICSGELISLNEIIDVFKEAAGKRIKITYNKDFIEKSYPLKGSFGKAKKILNWIPRADFKLELKELYKKNES